VHVNLIISAENEPQLPVSNYNYSHSFACSRFCCRGCMILHRSTTTTATLSHAPGFAVGGACFYTAQLQLQPLFRMLQVLLQGVHVCTPLHLIAIRHKGSQFYSAHPHNLTQSHTHKHTRLFTKRTHVCAPSHTFLPFFARQNHSQISLTTCHSVVLL